MRLRTNREAYIHGLLSREEEVENFSINVTEALIRDWSLFVFVEEARRRGLKAKHAVGTHTRRSPYM